MIIISAPSGAGKSSFLKRVLEDFTDLQDTVTYTTRKMRKGEVEGDPYHFVTEERFRDLIKEGFFVEWAQVHDNLYGTPLHQIEDAHKEGKTVIMDVDVKGAETFRKKYPDAVTIFILPPSIEELRKRIIGRENKAPANLELRLENARKEMSQVDLFDHKVVNDDFETSYQQFKTIISQLLSTES